MRGEDTDKDPFSAVNKIKPLPRTLKVIVSKHVESSRTINKQKRKNLEEEENSKSEKRRTEKAKEDTCDKIKLHICIK